METIARETAFSNDLEAVFQEQLLNYEFMYDGDDIWFI